jgi:hypothetical protein
MKFVIDQSFTQDRLRNQPFLCLSGTLAINDGREIRTLEVLELIVDLLIDEPQEKRPPLYPL